ncbi:MAG TPA: hypothetical protein VHK64_08170 [Nocardioidaceae bacterium]|jgi:hypothetical protein|nr:hypothetical protein [Nocardioidaceae bacterium]
MTPQAAAALDRLRAETAERHVNRGRFDRLADELRTPEFAVAVDPALVGRECCDDDSCDCGGAG